MQSMQPAMVCQYSVATQWASFCVDYQGNHQGNHGNQHLGLYAFTAFMHFYSYALTGSLFRMEAHTHHCHLGMLLGTHVV